MQLILYLSYLNGAMPLKSRNMIRWFHATFHSDRLKALLWDGLTFNRSLVLSSVSYLGMYFNSLRTCNPHCWHLLWMILNKTCPSNTLTIERECSLISMAIIAILEPLFDMTLFLDLWFFFCFYQFLRFAIIKLSKCRNKNNLVIVLRKSSKSWEIVRNQQTISCQTVANNIS